MIRDIDGWHIGRWYRGGEKREGYRVAPEGLTARCETTRGAGLCELLDLSTGGVQLATYIPVGSRVLLELHLPDGHAVLTSGTVVRRMQDDCVGVVFDDLYDEQQELIRQVVRDCIADQNRH